MGYQFNKVRFFFFPKINELHAVSILTFMYWHSKLNSHAFKQKEHEPICLIYRQVILMLSQLCKSYSIFQCGQITNKRQKYIK